MGKQAKLWKLFAFITILPIFSVAMLIRALLVVSTSPNPPEPRPPQCAIIHRVKFNADGTETVFPNTISCQQADGKWLPVATIPLGLEE